jgi:catechol 2,3-dioxygenase-like lactoylglutathione lyase family enzyme
MKGLDDIFHIGHVVEDLDTAVADFESRFGIEVSRPAFDLEVVDGLVRGEKQSFTARFIFLGIGGTELELIQPVSGVSPYRLFLDEAGPGVHHLAFLVDSIDERLAQVRARSVAAGPLLLDARLGADGRFVYVDGAAHGVAIELIEPPSDIDLNA